MPRKIVFDAEARLEFEAAIVWYETEQSGLGKKFEMEVDSALQRILHNPERFPVAGNKIRKAQVKTFDKYGIYFRVEPQFIGVVSIFHGARDRAELRRRLR